MRKIFISFLIIFVCLFFSPFALICRANDNISELIQYIEASQIKEDMQAWLDDELTDHAGQGSADFYAIALSKSYDYLDFSKYSDALYRNGILNTKQAAVSRQRCALAYLAVGGKSAQDECVQILSKTRGKQGIMGLVYELHLENNGIRIVDESPEKTTQQLVKLQCTDGGWSIQGETGDTDVTAMVLQAIQPTAAENNVFDESISRAITFLSEQQSENGGYRSYGVENPESAAQVWTALSIWGIDALSDARFVKNGHSILDAILTYQLQNGAFSHQLDGNENAMATVQVYFSLQTYQLYLQNKKSIYLFDDISNNSSQHLTDSVEYSSNAPIKYDLSHNFTMKATILIGIWLLIVTLLILQRIRKQKTWKAYIPFVLIGMFATAFVLMLDFQTAKNTQTDLSQKPNMAGTIQMSISCDTIIEMENCPQDLKSGSILDTTNIAFCKGETAIDVLLYAAKALGIQTDVSGISGSQTKSAYVRGIQNLYEFDFGELSGWTFWVNGEQTPVGAGNYTLVDGDCIEWKYTCSPGENIIISKRS